MKKKLATLILLLSLSGFNVTDAINIESTNKTNTQQILITQLKNLLKELDKDIKSKKLIGYSKNAEKYFGDKERERIRLIAKNLSKLTKLDELIIERALYLVIEKESGFNPKAVNYQKGDSKNPKLRYTKRATGLIQWLPSTAKSYNTTTEEIYNMSVLEQLEYVEKYFINCANRYDLKNIPDFYFAVFNPSSIGKPYDHVIGKSGSLVQKLNQGIDKKGNNDGILQVSDVHQWLLT